MNCIKEYEIDVVGDTQGLVGAIPADHRLCVTQASIYHDGEEWVLHMNVETYKDNTYSQRIKNDNFKFGDVRCPLGATIPTSGIKTLVKNEMNALLDGFANVGATNYTEDPA